jgi:hypothetical protein
MPGPFSALSKIEKAEIGKVLEETIEVDGRIIKKGDLMEFEIERGLMSGRSQEDIMKKLRQQGIDVAPNYVKERMGVARTRKTKDGRPIKGDRPDPRYAKMEANYIIQRELNAGKTWEEISSTLLASGFNGPKLTEVARGNHAKKMQQASPPAVIDRTIPNAPSDLQPNLSRLPWAKAMKGAGFSDAELQLTHRWMMDAFTGETIDKTARDFGMSVEDLTAKGMALQERLNAAGIDVNIANGQISSNLVAKRRTPPAEDTGSGPMAPEDQPPVFDPEAEARQKNRQVLDDSKKTDEQWQAEFREIGIQAGKLREQAMRDLRGKSEEEIAASPWMAKMEEMVRSLRDSIIPTGAKATQGSQTTVPENLDVPVAPAGIDGPVEPEFRNR